MKRENDESHIIHAKCIYHAMDNKQDSEQVTTSFWFGDIQVYSHMLDGEEAKRQNIMWGWAKGTTRIEW